MIDFRYHIVSIVAVFLALALGLFLGSTTLQGKVLDSLHSRVHDVANNNSRLTKEKQTLTTEVGGDQAFLTQLAPLALAGHLDGETVAVVSSPLVDSSVINDVEGMIRSGGATITAQVELQAALFESSQSTELNSLAKRLRPASLTLPAAPGAPRVEAELAAVLAHKPGTPIISEATSQRVLSSYVSAKVISVHGSVTDIAPAELTVLLVPAPLEFPAASRTADSTVLTSVAGELAQSSTGTVVGGPATALADGGILQQERADSARPANLATVDSDDTVQGQVDLAFALLAVVNGQSGDYGVTGGSSLPSPTSSP